MNNEAMKVDFKKWVNARYMHPDIVFRHGYAWDAWQAALSQPKCSCDGSGLVHSPDGQFLGTCDEHHVSQQPAQPIIGYESREDMIQRIVNEADAKQQPAQTSNGIDDPVMISAKEMSLKMARDASAAPQLCFPDIYPGLKKLSSVAALSQQPEPPTVKESLTVQAQPSCGQSPYMWAISGSNARAWATNEIAKANLRNPDLDVIPLYTVQPDYEALRAENAQLKENAKQFIDSSLVAKWLAFTSPQVHEAFLKEFK